MAQAERALYQKYLDEVARAPKRAPQAILRFFPETHLGNSHAGLSKLAEEHKIQVTKLKPGEYVVFVNRAQTALKMYAPGNVVAHLKMPSGAGRIDPRVIRLMPRFFSGGVIDYDSALETILKREFGRG